MQSSNTMAEGSVSSPVARSPSDLKQYSTLEPLLRDEPLHSRCIISHLFADALATIQVPKEVHFHCDHEKCGGIRRHVYERQDALWTQDGSYAFLRYGCTNCTTTLKIFGLKAEAVSSPKAGICTKIYQEPSFGEAIPKRLFEIIGEDNREFFLQARRAIARGLGIGAYAYYRRIVENTKFDLVSSVLRVAQATNSPSGQIDLLQKAQSERQFSKAIDLLRDASAIPPVLLIDGHNPLVLLHDLLSEGIHKLPDAECLERARQAEIVLSETAGRMQVALTQRKNLKAAITSIMNRKAKCDQPDKPSSSREGDSGAA
jgi:hypothetical protein